MKILHFYYDIMNLYGDYANISAMKRLLEKSGTEVTVDRLSFGAETDLSQYDFIFIGSGTERNQKVVLDDLRRYRESLKACLDGGKVILMTGNSFEMLGKTITDASGKTYDGLGFYDFTVTEQNHTRDTADAILVSDISEKPLVGFINKCSEINGITAPLFQVRMGLGNHAGDLSEGIRDKNFFGTHLTGPVLIKNPHFLCYLAQLILGSDTALSTDHLTYETAGYEITLTELTKRLTASNA